MPFRFDNINNCFAALTTALVLSILTGCGSSSTDSDSVKPAEQRNDSNEKTTSILPSQSGTEGSPAQLANRNAAKKSKTDNTFDQTPDGLCRRFMELLQADNALAAENLLTRISQMNTTKEELELKSIGGPTAKFNVGEIRYATNQKNIAQVDCKITDAGSSEPFEIELTWLVKRQKKSWRISGVMMQIDDDATPDLLSFENITDVRRIKAINDHEVLAEDVSAPKTRQADAGDQTSKLKY